jgi:predicted DNA-binding protein
MAVLDKTRFDIRMSPELAEQLDSISTSTGLTRAEIFRRAVALYKRAKEVERSDGHVLLKDADGTTRELIGL